MLIWQLSQYSLRKLFWMKLETTACSWSPTLQEKPNELFGQPSSSENCLIFFFLQIWDGILNFLSKHWDHKFISELAGECNKIYKSGSCYPLGFLIISVLMLRENPNEFFGQPNIYDKTLVDLSIFKELSWWFSYAPSVKHYNYKFQVFKIIK